MDTFNNLDDTMIEVAPVYAGFGARFGAALLDFIFLLPLIGASTYFTIFSPNATGWLLISVISLLYGPLMDHFMGGTGGKLVLKQRVIQQDGSQITLAQGFLRAAPWLIGGLANIYVGYQIFGIPGLDEVDGFMEYSLLIAEYQADQDSMVMSLVPQLAWILPLISSLFIFGNAQNQAAHDILAETFVVTNRN